MFTMITSSHWGERASTLSRIFKTREGSCTTEIDAFDISSTLYIAYEKKAHGVFGSCRLNFLENSPAASFYQKTFSLSDKWLEVSLISFERVDDDDWSEGKTGVAVRAEKNFYKGLYRFLVNLSLDLGLEGLMTLSSEPSHPHLRFVGKWPFRRTCLFKTEDSGASFAIGELPMLPQEDTFSLLGEAV